MEDDSKEKKSGCAEGSCVKGSRMRKPVPPVAPRPPVVSTVELASSGSISGSPLGESTVLRMRLNILLTRCVMGSTATKTSCCGCVQEIND